MVKQKEMQRLMQEKMRRQMISFQMAAARFDSNRFMLLLLLILIYSSEYHFVVTLDSQSHSFLVSA